MRGAGDDDERAEQVGNVLPIYLIHSFVAAVLTLAQRNEEIIDYAVEQLYEATEILDPG